MSVLGARLLTPDFAINLNGLLREIEVRVAGGEGQGRALEGFAARRIAEEGEQFGGEGSGIGGGDEGEQARLGGEQIAAGAMSEATTVAAVRRGRSPRGNRAGGQLRGASAVWVAAMTAGPILREVAGDDGAPANGIPPLDLGG